MASNAGIWEKKIWSLPLRSKTGLNHRRAACAENFLREAAIFHRAREHESTNADGNGGDRPIAVGGRGIDVPRYGIGQVPQVPLEHGAHSCITAADFRRERGHGASEVRRIAVSLAQIEGSKLADPLAAA